MSKSLSEMLGIDPNDPVYIEAKRQAKEKFARGAKDTSCPNGCVNIYDPETGEVFSGFGVAGCKTPICSGEQTHVTACGISGTEDAKT